MPRNNNNLMMVVVGLTIITLIGWIAPGVLDFLGVVIKALVWPALIALVLIMFGNDLLPVLKNKISELETFGKEGAKFKPIQRIIDKDKVSGKIINSDEIGSKKGDETAVKSELLNNLREITEKQVEEIVSTGKNKNDVLINSIVNMDMQIYFERINAYIFQSQIDLLSQMKLLEHPAVKGWVETFYLGSSKHYKNYSFAEWLIYLIGNKLIEEVEGEGYKITELGIYFINYLETQNLINLEFRSP